MNYYTIPPPQILSPYVRFYWVLEASEVSAAVPYVHRSMADGCCEMLFHYRGAFQNLGADGATSPSYQSGIDGPSQKYQRYQAEAPFGIFGTYMYPFALTAFFGIPASAIVNHEVDVPTLLGQPGKDLEEQIMLAKNNAERVVLMNRFLESRLKLKRTEEPAVFSAINDVIRLAGLVTVDELADKHCLSTRQLERKFKAFSGFSPKLYTRIVRFQAALAKYQHKGLSLTEVAYLCGYYDQSHFIHDFKEFSGYHPKTYFSGDNEGTAWKDSE